MSSALRPDPPSSETTRWGSNHPGYRKLKLGVEKGTIPLDLGLSGKKSLSDIDFVVWNSDPDFYRYISRINFRRKYLDLQQEKILDTDLSGQRKASDEGMDEGWFVYFNYILYDY